MCPSSLCSRAAAEKAISASNFARKIAKVTQCTNSNHFFLDLVQKFPDVHIAFQLRCKTQDADDAGRRANDSQNLALKAMRCISFCMWSLTSGLQAEQEAKECAETAMYNYRLMMCVDLLWLTCMSIHCSYMAADYTRLCGLGIWFSEMWRAAFTKNSPNRIEMDCSWFCCTRHLKLIASCTRTLSAWAPSSLPRPCNRNYKNQTIQNCMNGDHKFKSEY